MELQTQNPRHAQSVAQHAVQVFEIATLLCSGSYALRIEGRTSKVEVLTPGGLLAGTSMVAAPLHSPPRTRSEPSSVSDFGATTEEVDSKRLGNPAAQYRLPASVPVT